MTTSGLCGLRGWLKLCFGLALLTTPLCAFPDTGLSVEDARLRAPLPGQSATVAYLLLRNSGNIDRRLVAVEVEGAQRAELHEHRHENGMMKMRAVDSLVVEAGADLEFRPHSYHIMVFGFDREALSSPGGQVQLRLLFADGGELLATAKVFR